MESLRRPGGRRVLLPAEVELCETVGITEDEYWYFVELTQSFNGKRPYFGTNPICFAAPRYNSEPFCLDTPLILNS